MQYSFGDYNSYNSGTSFYIDVLNSTIYTKHSGQQEGLFFDFVNDYFQIGDFAGTNNGTFLSIDDDNQFIASYGNGNLNGLKLDFANNFFQIGEFGLNNGTYLEINDNLRFIKSYHQGNAKGLNLDYDLMKYYLGDFDNSNQNTFLTVDDDNTTIFMRTDHIELYGNLTNNNIHTPSGKYLQMNINGTNYHIPLYN
jgi:hypothetical protein